MVWINVWVHCGLIGAFIFRTKQVYPLEMVSLSTTRCYASLRSWNFWNKAFGDHFKIYAEHENPTYCTC
ncbi:MAG: hypothetical protein RLZZ262_1227 [Bacteroidota bacterium]